MATTSNLSGFITLIQQKVVLTQVITRPSATITAVVTLGNGPTDSSASTFKPVIPDIVTAQDEPPPPPPSSGGSGLSSGALAGILCSLFVVIFFALLCCTCHKRHQREHHYYWYGSDSSNSSSSSSSSSTTSTNSLTDRQPQHSRRSRINPKTQLDRYYLSTWGRQPRPDSNTTAGQTGGTSGLDGTISAGQTPTSSWPTRATIRPFWRTANWTAPNVGPRVQQTPKYANYPATSQPQYGGVNRNPWSGQGRGTRPNRGS